MIVDGAHKKLKLDDERAAGAAPASDFEQPPAQAPVDPLGSIRNLIAYRGLSEPEIEQIQQQLGQRRPMVHSQPSPVGATQLSDGEETSTSSLDEQETGMSPQDIRFPPTPNELDGVAIDNPGDGFYEQRRAGQQQANAALVNSSQLRPRKKFEKITDAQLDNLSALIKIIRNGNFNEFSDLLSKRTGLFETRNLLNVFIEGQTALHYTLIYGRSLAWCKQLVSCGANPNLTNRAGWHPIHLAAFNGSRDTLRYLIDCLAE